MSTHLLPARAQTKLSAMADAADDAAALALVTTRRISELQKALALNPDGEGAADVEHELSRLRAVQSLHQQRRRDRINLVARLRQWLASLPPGSAIITTRSASGKPRKGETCVVAVARLRGEISSVRESLRETEAASPPKADLKQMARAHVQQLAERGRPTVIAGPAGLHVRYAPIANAPGFDAPALLAWANPDALLARLESEIDALPVPKLALAADEKARRVADLTATLDKLEREEEAIIEAATDDGQVIERRPDASPAAILGITLRADEVHRAA